MSRWSVPTQTLTSSRRPAREPTPCPALELLNSPAQNQTVLGSGGGQLRLEEGCEKRGDIDHSHPWVRLTACVGLAT